MVKTLKTACLVWLLIIIFLATACMPGDMAVSQSTDPDETTAAAFTPAPTAEPTPKPTPAPTPEPTPEPTPAPTLEPIESLIASMSDQELIGQMVMIGFTGTEDMDSEYAQMMRDGCIGNVMLFGWNTKTFEQTKALNDKIQAYGVKGIPVMIGLDVEGGTVERFKGQWKPRINSARTLGKKNDPQLVYEQYKQIGQKLKETGIMIDFAPVLDIAHKPSATFLANRMFGSDAEQVSLLIRQAVKGLHDGGIASLGKHFPGHGYTNEDSHQTLPVINASLDEMTGYSLVPFAAAIDEGIDAMLAAHLSYTQIDSESITSLSPTVITGLLRESMGFQGVVVSDDMRMLGLRSQCSAGEGAVRHILAGGDIVLIGKHVSLQQDILNSLNQAVQDGRITRERLEESVRRILALKQKYTGFI